MLLNQMIKQYQTYIIKRTETDGKQIEQNSYFVQME